MRSVHQVRCVCVCAVMQRRGRLLLGVSRSVEARKAKTQGLVSRRRDKEGGAVDGVLVSRWGGRRREAGRRRSKKRSLR